jgi:hypothetical protein
VRLKAWVDGGHGSTHCRADELRALAQARRRLIGNLERRGAGAIAEKGREVVDAVAVQVAEGGRPVW